MPPPDALQAPLAQVGGGVLFARQLDGGEDPSIAGEIQLALPGDPGCFLDGAGDIRKDSPPPPGTCEVALLRGGDPVCLPGITEQGLLADGRREAMQEVVPGIKPPMR